MVLHLDSFYPDKRIVELYLHLFLVSHKYFLQFADFCSGFRHFNYGMPIVTA
ncbi:hypothetical protein H1P_6770003 [Hyella patelloides LEGE 07179]|uniref:Transposase n=1 Tax=Hyella patelloides LEGE 07179 TaxID=945734 RepID=A0A563W329_9CYAN|nr:hypothetical protein H1P_6770003 [Hyella patelloides LEGE 07179]